jgi:hypothetical protein
MNIFTRVLIKSELFLSIWKNIYSKQAGLTPLWVMPYNVYIADDTF